MCAESAASSGGCRAALTVQSVLPSDNGRGTRYEIPPQELPVGRCFWMGVSSWWRWCNCVGHPKTTVVLVVGVPRSDGRTVKRAIRLIRSNCSGAEQRSATWTTGGGATGFANSRSFCLEADPRRALEGDGSPAASRPVLLFGFRERFGVQQAHRLIAPMPNKGYKPRHSSRESPVAESETPRPTKRCARRQLFAPGLRPSPFPGLFAADLCKVSYGRQTGGGLSGENRTCSLAQLHQGRYSRLRRPKSVESTGIHWRCGLFSAFAPGSFENQDLKTLAATTVPAVARLFLGLSESKA
ncbi:uncharacterized protein BP5553_01573 [Venustampulla echinocandica]|uniref:Uncharacterized protein n=1 Tax=Venustampulla echinocandica TaxID=2656787 RepID=A0A370U1E8_9HELO|nr:uncharacterized protein BP5553_01573 [Venustampulla echinocandica]RDL41594.1 hypothetical protein BP5553_01573 [Venustampulla echinocandica]